MANYANLLATIAANIYTNGNQEVTAAMVKSAVDAMVGSLGYGYQFRGAAAPSDNPGTPDQNVMYFAATAGTYTNFDGIVVNDGEFCALCWNGSWVKKTTGAATAEQVPQYVEEDGFFIVDEQLNIGFAVDSNGAHAANIPEYQILSI